jgi:hypothetical protein
MKKQSDLHGLIWTAFQDIIFDEKNRTKHLWQAIITMHMCIYTNVYMYVMVYSTYYLLYIIYRHICI